MNENLIKRFGTILNAINCKEEVGVEKFERYCSETAKLYVSLYRWYPMTNTVHKVLVHGGKIISGVSLAIGMFSEESQEAINKVYRHNRLYHSRKCSRIATNEDVMKTMLARSDPYLYYTTRTKQIWSPELTAAVQSLLKLS